MAIDRSNSINPYTYLAGVVSLGPTKCGTAGYPGNIKTSFFIFCFFIFCMFYPLTLFCFLFSMFSGVYTVMRTFF